MTRTSEHRYRTPTTAYGPGVDLLLDREVTVARFARDDAARIARGLRATATSSWLEVLDAYAESGDVVVVMPSTRGSLAQDLAAGLPAHRAIELDDDLPNALADLRALGLAPVSLDADQIGMTPSGHPLLLPAPGPGELTVEHATLLASLSRHSRALSPTSGRNEPAAAEGLTSELPQPSVLTRPELVARPAPSEAVRFPRAGLTAAETGRKDSSGRRRTVALAVGAAAAVLAVGVVATSQTEQPAGRAVAGGVSGQAVVAAQADPLQSALADLEADPAGAGTGAAGLADRLRATQSATGAAQSFQAAGVLGAVTSGRADGSLDGPLVAAVEQAVTPLAQPRDLTALVDLVAVDPVAFGPRVPKFNGRLVKLQTLAGEAAQVEAADLVQIVSAGVAKGEFTAAFRDIALPVLRPLAGAS